MPRRVAVIGAGAAGTMAAIFAAAGGAETLLLERTRDGGRKILISGGGRCNILPARVDERRFVTDSSPHTLRNILRSWPLAEQIAFFERELGLTLVEERETAKLFPASNRARDVRDGLLALAARRGARVLPETTITDRARGRRLAGRAGAGAAVGGGRGGHRHRRALGAHHRKRRPRARDARGAGAHGAPDVPGAHAGDQPARHRSRRSPASRCRSRLTARDGRRSAGSSGGFLFTHRGYSGPSVLDVSHVLARSRLEGDGARSALGPVVCARRGGVGARAPSRRARVPSRGVLRRELPDRLAGRAGRGGRRRPVPPPGAAPPG